MLIYVFLCSFYDPLKVAPWRYYATCRIHACTPHSADLQLSLLLNGVRHTIWMGYLKHFFLCSIRQWDYLEPVIHLLENNFCSKTCMCTVLDKTLFYKGTFFHYSIRAWDGYSWLWTAIHIMEIKQWLL